MTRAWAAVVAVCVVEASRAVAMPLLLASFVDLAAARSTAGELSRVAVVYLLVAVAGVPAAVALAAAAERLASTVADAAQLADVAAHLDGGGARTSAGGTLEEVRIHTAATAVAGRWLPAATAVLAVGVALAVGHPLTAVVVGAPAVLLLAARPLLRRGLRADRAAEDRGVARAALAGELVHARDDLRGVQACEPMLRVLRDEQAAASRLAVRAGLRSTTWPVLLQLTSGVAFLVALWLAAAAVARGEGTVGGLFAIVNYVFLLRAPVATLAAETRSAVRLLGALRADVPRRGTTDADPDRDGHHGQRAPAPVRLRDVTFGYRAGHDVLRSLSLDVPAGNCLVVRGPSGCGKSTLLGVVAGALAPRSGHVDGVRSPAPGDVVLVPQRPHVMHADVVDNVTLYDPAVAPDDVRDALELVGLDQLDPSASTVPDRLSPAQARLLGLARGLARRPRVLLVDEPTAHLDDDGAAAVRVALARVHGRCTLVVATHDDTLDVLGEQVLFLGASQELHAVVRTGAAPGSL